MSRNVQNIATRFRKNFFLVLLSFPDGQYILHVFGHFRQFFWSSWCLDEHSLFYLLLHNVPLLLHDPVQHHHDGRGSAQRAAGPGRPAAGSAGHGAWQGTETSPQGRPAIDVWRCLNRCGAPHWQGWQGWRHLFFCPFVYLLGFFGHFLQFLPPWHQILPIVSPVSEIFKKILVSPPLFDRKTQRNNNDSFRLMEKHRMGMYNVMLLS